MLVWVGVSGGRDSLALLYACVMAGLSFRVLHVNHGLHPDADKWAQKVACICVGLKICCNILHLDKKPNNEKQARNARYQAMLSQMQDGDVLILGHHQEDQAETVLLKLLRGAGVEGLAAMAPLVEQCRFGRKFWLSRPLLSVSRAQITAFCKIHNIDYIDDSTNFNPNANARAYLRQNIMPILQARFGNVVPNIAMSACHLSSACNELAQHKPWQQNQWFETLLISDVNVFVLRRWLIDAHGYAPSSLVLTQIMALASRADPNHQTTIAWQNMRVHRYKDLLYKIPTHTQKILSQKFAPINLTKNTVYRIDCIEILSNADVLLTPIQGGVFTIGGHRHKFKKMCQRFGVPWFLRDFAFLVQKNGVAQGVLFVHKFFALDDNDGTKVCVQCANNATLDITFGNLGKPPCLPNLARFFKDL